MRDGLLGLVVVVVVGCGGRPGGQPGGAVDAAFVDVLTDTGSTDANRLDAATDTSTRDGPQDARQDDASGVVCGGQTCGPGTVCVIPCCGGTPPPCYPFEDGGTCPAGTSPGQCWGQPMSYGCTSNCTAPPPFCAPLPSECSANPCACSNPCQPESCMSGPNGEIQCLCA